MIQPEQIGILRVVKGAAASVLLALIFNQAAMGAKELSRRTAWCESEITEALKDLADLGLIENFARYNGWALTPRARTLIVAGLVEGELPVGEGAASAAVELSPAVQDSPGSSGSGPPAATLKSAAEHVAEAGSVPAKSGSPVPAGSTAVKEEVNLTVFKNQETPTHFNSDSPDASQLEGVGCSPLSGLAARGVTSRRILECTRQLFGERVLGSLAKSADPGWLLALVAEAYVNRQSLRKPARVVFANLKNQHVPEARYVDNPCAYLPPDFVAAIGLSPPQPCEHSAGDELETDWDEVWEPDEPPPEAPEEPSLSLPVKAGSTRSAAQAWEMAQGVLRLELPAGVFDQRVKTLRLLRFAPETGCFTLAASDEQHCLWLQDRLALTLTRLMQGICGRECAVEFVFS